ncbi:MAG: class IV adenylate cyclase [Candidatus Paceibacterota bacterium]|jgi:adenylate cyclase class 2
MREIEIKLKVENLGELAKKLSERGYELSDPIQQHDIVYSLKDKPQRIEYAKEGDISIRIRRSGGKAELNLKQQQSNEMDNLEYETEVKDPEAMHQILLKLGYVPEVEVKKIRRKGKLGPYEICLDEVERLGTFVELEKLAPDNTDPEEIREELFRELEKLGLSRKDEETRGYDNQILQLDI